MAYFTRSSWQRPPTKPLDFPVDPLLERLLGLSTPHKFEHFIVKVIKDCPFIAKHKLEEIEGNVLVTVGDNPSSMFSCHMDIVGTVSKANEDNGLTDKIVLLTSADKSEKRKGIIYGAKPQVRKGTKEFISYSPSTLGADDKVGVYLNLRMIERGIPGLYVFHVGEERGGIGSEYLSKHHPERFENIKRAIAFDRAGYSDVIEFQRGGRCCSSEFGKDLAAKLSQLMPPFIPFKAGVTGTFTDTANYRDLIPECTNLSVGYFNQHGDTEHLDYIWLRNMFLPAILKVEWDKLVTKRDPKEKPVYSNNTTYWSNRTGVYENKNRKSWKEATLETQNWDLPAWTPDMGFVAEAQDGVLLKAIKYYSSMNYNERDKFAEAHYTQLMLNEVLKTELKILKKQIRDMNNSKTAEEEEELPSDPAIIQKKEYLQEFIEWAQVLTLTHHDVLFHNYAKGAVKFLERHKTHEHPKQFTNKEFTKLNKMIFTMWHLMVLDECDLDQDADAFLMEVHEFISQKINEPGFDIKVNVPNHRQKPLLLTETNRAAS